MMTKAFTMRLPEEKAAELEAVARADGVPVSETVRDAIDQHIDARRKDKDFQARLSKLVEDNQRVLDRLAQ
jgi:predicted DNA-binding protein